MDNYWRILLFSYYFPNLFQDRAWQSSKSDYRWCNKTVKLQSVKIYRTKVKAHIEIWDFKPCTWSILKIIIRASRFRKYVTILSWTTICSVVDAWSLVRHDHWEVTLSFSASLLNRFLKTRSRYNCSDRNTLFRFIYRISQKSLYLYSVIFIQNYGFQSESNSRMHENEKPYIITETKN